MSKYNVGDKVVMKITNRFKNAYGHEYCSVLDSLYSADFIDNKVEPLSTYTEPLEAKIRRQAAEITRLLAENEKLKKENETLNVKIDYCELYSDKHEEEYNQAFNQGAETAWELARKIVLKNGYSAYDLHEIFNCCGSHQALEDYTYQEVAAKVAEWEKAKEEIKVGDVLENIYISKVKCVVTNLYPDNMAYSIFGDGTAGMHELNKFKKTGRHIDIDSFLKQIRGE